MPPRVEYSLTEFGLSLKPILELMGAWGEEYRLLVEGLARHRAGDATPVDEN